ncbi:hypothetical protein PIROE2DRAFT_9615 [Piromyces sp. E2]|nr:hypothetical protein PIROE2DRAFT_9615 [Piromyces sp. E2]|eukprot:OUM63813.1 hypothetical protein PIROE2DRAFT_9615 [Piromyces sp. E2]
MNYKSLSILAFTTLLSLVNCDNITTDNKLTPGTETNAAILDLELVTKNLNTTVSDSYVIIQCFSCGYAGACVNTCANGKPSKCESDCVGDVLDKATDSLGDIFFDIFFLPAAEISFGANVVKCMSRC